MKKIVFLIVAVCLGLASCDSDDNDLVEINSGQYLYSDNAYTVSISDPRAGGITIFENGECVFQQLYSVIFSVAENADCFSWIYDDGLTLETTYSTLTSFTAVVKDNQTGIDLPAKMKFKLDNTVLDANGDGILDSKQ